MDDDEFDWARKRQRRAELARWTMELLKTLPLPDVIKAVDERRRDADGDDYRALTMDLSFFLCAAGRESEAVPIIDEMIARLLDDVRFPIVRHYASSSMNDPGKALEVIEVALARAHRTEFFRREALGVKARILLELGHGDQLSQTLEEMMALEIKRDIPDSGRERDFVDRAPPGMIREDVLARYNVFAGKIATETRSRADLQERLPRRLRRPPSEFFQIEYGLLESPLELCS